MWVADFDATNGTVTVRQSKSGRARHVVLTDEGIELFRQLADGNAGNAPLFGRAGGQVWGRSHQHRPLRDACARAEVSPAVSFHVLRHTYASHLVMAGVPLQVIAANLGHADTRMTERHYAHLAPAFVANAIRAAMPRWITQQAG
jgi:integrase